MDLKTIIEEEIRKVIREKVLSAFETSSTTTSSAPQQEEQEEVEEISSQQVSGNGKSG